MIVYTVGNWNVEYRQFFFGNETDVGGAENDKILFASGDKL